MKLWPRRTEYAASTLRRIKANRHISNENGAEHVKDMRDAKAQKGELMKRMILMLLMTVLSRAATGQDAHLYAATPSESAGASAGAQGAPVQGQTTLRVIVGRSLVVNSPEPLKRVSVTDPAIAAAVIISPTQVLINGLKAGTVTLLLWDEQERARSFDLQVELDVPALRETYQRLLAGETIQVRQSGGSLVITGSVSSESVSTQAENLARTQTDSVVNLLGVLENNDVVSLQVRFAEVDRAAVQELGISVISTGAGNTIGTVTTQQFGPVQGNVGAVPSGVDTGQDPQTPSLASGGIGNDLEGTPSVFGLTDLLNLFIFRSDINLGAAVRALQQRNLLQILAEPNVLAMNGREASFLAGGEFPFPIVQGGTNFTAVTIEFKEFGVRLKFTPQILEDERIRLKVTPEVSTLDFSNALTVSGFLIPAISTRRAETEVELKNGQSFAIAGLIDDRLTEIASKIPVLGDVPFLGRLFRSRSVNKTNTELLVMVTPTLVEAMDPDQVPPGPEYPLNFLDKEQFDESRKPSGSKEGSN